MDPKNPDQDLMQAITELLSGLETQGQELVPGLDSNTVSRCLAMDACATHAFPLTLQ